MAKFTDHIIEVRGVTTVVRTNRRFAVLSVRPKAVSTDEGTYVAFAQTEGTTDSEETARNVRDENLWHRGPDVEVLIVDLVESREVA